ncbi:MAG: hypothetical protein KC656_02030 [Myxococcales bacterium]|nr:hypothetical protein [Myxococcales bacterium]
MRLLVPLALAGCSGFDPDGTWVLTRSAETTDDGQVVVDYPLDLDGSTYTASLRVEAPSAWLVDTEDGPGGTVVLEDGPYPFVREEKGVYRVTGVGTGMVCEADVGTGALMVCEVDFGGGFSIALEYER